MFGNKPRMMPKANASHSKGRNYVTAMIFHNKPKYMAQCNVLQHEFEVSQKVSEVSNK